MRLLDADVSIGAITSEHALRLESILHATGVFSPDEIRVALELLDEACRTSVHDCSPPPYSVLGSFTPDGELVGFACYQAAPESAHQLNEFEHLWDRHSQSDPNLARLHL